MKSKKPLSKEEIEREMRFFKQLAFSTFAGQMNSKGRGYLSESHPKEFERFSARWEELLNLAKQDWFTQSALRISECLKEIGEMMGTLGGGPSDVAEIYLGILKRKAQSENAEGIETLDIGRAMALELTGFLAHFYGTGSYAPARDFSRPLSLRPAIHKTPKQLQIRILLIEDNPGDAEFLRGSLRKEGHGHLEILWAPSLKEGSAILEKETFSVIITDLSLGDSDKAATFDRVLRASGGIPVIVMTGLDDEELALNMVRSGAQDYLVKGQIDARSLLRSIRFSVERKSILDELQLAREEANKATQAKSQFLANMSHEIRTPLNSILGMAQIFLEAPLDAEHKKYAELLNRAGKSLLHLIDEILDLSKVEAGKLALEEAPFDLTEVVEDAVEFSSVKAREKGLKLSYQVSAKIPPSLFGDANRLRQILMNLLGNALKFTERGEIVLDVIPDPAGGEPGAIQISVRDTGIGIPKDKIAKIFDSFSQAHNSPELFGGTGLGLAISKRLAEKMGGRIWCQSEEGKGSTFFVSVPLLIAPQAPPKEAADLKSLQGARALIVEPDPSEQEDMSKVLDSWRMSVVCASSVDEGLGELMRSAATKPLDIVLVNCRLQREGGFRFIEFIREIPTFRGKIVIILPADHLRDDPARCRRLGIPFLVKPLRRAELRQTLAKAIGKEEEIREVGEPATAASPAAAKPLRRILLVEDMPDNQFVVKVFVKELPYEIEIAENGLIAIEKVKAQSYDLILMDMRMPVMDGYEATRQIRKWEKQAGKSPVPILALTASTLKGEEYKALQAGCDAHLQKPIVKSRLLDAIVRFTSPAADAAPALAPAQKLAAEDLDPEIRQLVPVFLGRRREDAQKIKTALLQNDFDTVRTLGHNMKGSGSYFGYDALSDLGKRIESAAIEKSLEKSSSLLAELNSFLEAEASASPKIP